MKKFAFFCLAFGALFGEPECPKEPPLYFSIKHREARGIGYEDGYTSVTGTWVPRVTDDFFPFLDGRIHVFNNGKFASNLGLGVRVGFPSEHWALGANVYWDHREASPHFRVDGLGAGLEALSTWVDFRVNGYLPTGKTRSTKLKFERFSGNNVFVSQEFYRTIPSIFGEVGVPIPIKARFVDLYFGVGPYYLFKRDIPGGEHIGKTWGVKGRLENQVFGGLSLAVEASYDHEFHGVVQGIARWSFPLGPRNLRQDRVYWKVRNRWKGCQERARRDHLLTQRVVRNEIIPIDDRKVTGPLINPATGQPFSIIFVNNLNGIPGIGTFENPFWSLGLAETHSIPGSLIYVFTGDGTTFRMDSGFTFQPNQMMSGSGIPLQVGPISVPAFTPGTAPTVTNTAGSAITMADGAELAGFIVDGASVNGIVTAGTTGSIIRQNTIQNNTASGINTTGTPNVIIVNNTISDNTLHGIFSLNSTIGGENHIIEGNTVNNNGQRGIYYSGIGGGTLTIVSNTVVGNGTNGIDIISNFFGNGPESVTISGNLVTDNTGQGILCFLTRGAQTFTVSVNVIERNGVHGIAFLKLFEPRGPLAIARILNNLVDEHSAGFDGIRVDARGRVRPEIEGNVLRSTNGPTSNRINVLIPIPPLSVGSQMCTRLVNNDCDTGILLDNDPGNAATQMQVDAPGPLSLKTLQSINPASIITEVNPGQVTYGSVRK